MLALRTLASAVLAGAIFLLTGELAVRALNPTPPAQIVRGLHPNGSGRTLRVLHGQPVWETQGVEAREQPRCEAPLHVALFGSSVTYGAPWAHEEAVTGALQRRLAGRVPAVCVHGFARPGFKALSSLARAREVLPELVPDVVVWEILSGTPDGYSLLGRDAYNVSQLRQDALGYPVGLPLPSTLHHALFTRSRLYELGTLSLAAATRPHPPPSDVAEAYVREVLDPLRRLTEAQGSALVLWVASPFHQPLEATIAEQADPGLQFVRYRAWAEEHGAIYVTAAEALRGRELAEVALDPCCHLTAAGHDAVAEAMVGWLEAGLAGR